MLTAAGVLFDHSFSPRAAAGQDITLLTHMKGFDAEWYRGIIDLGFYESEPGSPAFYPLFPLLVGVVKALSLGVVGTYAAGAVVNTVAVWLAVLALVKIGDTFVAQRHRWAPVMLFLASPAAFFLHVFYAEATFCALAFWAYLAALRRRWPMTGILLGLLTAARLPGVLFVGLCGLEYLRSCDWRLSRVGARPLVWFALAPLGFLAFAAFLDIVTGDPLAMFHAYDRVSDWTYHEFDPNFLATILEEGRLALRALSGRGSFTERAFIDSVLPMASLVVLLVASTRAIADRRAARPMLPLGIFGLASIVMFTLKQRRVGAPVRPADAGDLHRLRCLRGPGRRGSGGADRVHPPRSRPPVLPLHPLHQQPLRRLIL